MGVTEDVIHKVQAPRTRVVVAIPRERRVQLEYKLHTTLVNPFVTREKNGTKYEMPNKSVVIVQIQGPEKPDIDCVKMKSKQWNEWITDKKPEEEKDAAQGD